MSFFRNRRRRAPSTSRPRLSAPETHATPAHLGVNTLGQVIDRTGNPPSPGQAPVFTAEAVFHQYAHRIYQLARRMLANEADAEDVTQEVLLQVVRKLDTFRGDADLATWLHRVTVNAALSHRRKQALQLARGTGAPLRHTEDQGQPVSSVSPRGTGPDGQLLGHELRERIEQAVRGLPAMYREPFVLSDIEGMPNAEIGARLGLSVAAVKSRLYRARRLLRDALTPPCRQGGACHCIAG